MAEQQLNGTDICAGFEEMNRESVPESMRRDRLAVARKLARFLTGEFNGASVNRLAGNIALEQPVFRPRGLPVAAERLQQLGRQHDVAILMPFALVDADEPSADYRYRRPSNEGTR